MEAIYELTSKDIKRLNDFNQVAKKVFNKYVLFENGIILCPEGESVIDKGIHFGFTETKLFNELPKGVVITLFSKAVFKTIKDRKKSIKYLKISNTSIFLAGDEDLVCFIGTISHIDKLSDEIKELYVKVKEYLERCQNDKIDVTSDVISHICENDLFTYCGIKHRLRITKEIMPGIKPDFPVAIAMNDIPNESKLFETVIEVKRKELISYHRYVCIKF